MGYAFAFKKVFLNNNSSDSKFFGSSPISFQFALLGPNPDLVNLFSKFYIWWKKLALISKSGRREFKYSNVLYNVHRYLFF